MRKQPFPFFKAVSSEIDDAGVRHEDKAGRAKRCVDRRANIEYGHSISSNGHPVTSTREETAVELRSIDSAPFDIEINPNTVRSFSDHLRQCLQVNIVGKQRFEIGGGQMVCSLKMGRHSTR